MSAAVDSAIEIIDSVGPHWVRVNPCCFRDGISTFAVVWDNLRLARLHTRLTLGMLARAPALLRTRAAARMRG